MAFNHEPRKCRKCGKEFIPAVTMEHYCAECRENRYQRPPALRALRWQKRFNKTPGKCNMCGKPVAGMRLFCPDCRKISMREKRKLQAKVPQEKTCVICGKTFVTYEHCQKVCHDCRADKDIMAARRAHLDLKRGTSGLAAARARLVARGLGYLADAAGNAT